MQAVYDFNFGIDDATLEQFPELKWLQDRSQLVGDQLRMARALQSQSRAEAAKQPGTEDDLDLEMPQAQEERLLSANKREAQDIGEACKESSRVELDRIIAGMGCTEPAERDRMRSDLEGVLKQYGGKRAKTEPESG